MTSYLKSLNSEPRRTLTWVMAALGVYWLALIHQLGAQWSAYEQYGYGWVVPFLCGYLLWQRLRKPEVRRQKSEIHEAKSEIGKSESENKFQLSTFKISDLKTPTSAFSLLLLLGCALLYAPTRFFHEANPIWRLTSLLWTLEVIGLTLIVLRLTLGTAQFRFSNFVFPIGFFLVAVPWPSGVESFLVQTFTRLNISSTVEVLGWFGIPAIQHGNIIEVATGEVGIDEACSGIRSFQATLMIALFFGELYRLTVARRAVCVVAGFALSFLFNLARTTLLTVVAAKKGVTSVAGWHDPAGVTILLGCFLTLWLLSLRLGKSSKSAVCLPTSDLRPPVSDLHLPTSDLRPIRWLAIALIGWFLLVEAGTELWFRLHERTVAAHGEWSLNVAAAGSRFTKQEMRAGIRAQFKADESVQAAGKDDAGNFWQAYYFRWLPSVSLNNRMAVQLAKTHGPEKCLPAIGMTMKADMGVITVPVGDRQIVLRQFVFLAGDRQLHVFYGLYEDATGSDTLANRRQNTAGRLAAALAGSRNTGQRYLELAVVGPETPVAAQAALREELAKLIQ